MKKTSDGPRRCGLNRHKSCWKILIFPFLVRLFVLQMLVCLETLPQPQTEILRQSSPSVQEAAFLLLFELGLPCQCHHSSPQQSSVKRTQDAVCEASFWPRDNMATPTKQRAHAGQDRSAYVHPSPHASCQSMTQSSVLRVYLSGRIQLA